MWWQESWVWFAAALVLAIFEVLLPGYVLLGFAIGAGLVGALLAFGLVGGSLPTMILIFALVALASWLGLRRALGVRRGQVRKIDHDIND